MRFLVKVKSKKELVWFKQRVVYGIPHYRRCRTLNDRIDSFRWLSIAVWSDGTSSMRFVISWVTWSAWWDIT